MRSEIEWADEWIDLPSLTEFKGNMDNFYAIGSVILESIDLVFDWFRYPSIIIQWNRLRCRLLLVHLFPPILKYPFSHFLIIRCCCSRIIHQKQKRLRLILIPVSSLPNESPWCSWTTEHSVNQPPTPSPFQTNRVPLNPFPARPQITRGVWRVESRNLWVSFSQNASGSLINIVHGSTDRVVGELRTLTSHAGLLPHHSSGEEKSDGPTARSSRPRFIRKIVGEQQGLVSRELVSKLKRFNSMR